MESQDNRNEALEDVRIGGRPAEGGRRFTSSCVVYPDRGRWGDASYRGNTTGRIVADFLMTYHRGGVFFDPMSGSGTAVEVALEMGLKAYHNDLRFGFDATCDDIRERVRRKTNQAIRTIFCHPPYAGMIRYSRDVWGDREHPRDISACGDDVEAFAESMRRVLRNCSRALDEGGVLGVLIGDWRVRGRVHDLAHVVQQVAPRCLALSDKIIKIQQNVASDRKEYRNFGVRLMHETLLVFSKQDNAAQRDADDRE